MMDYIKKDGSNNHIIITLHGTGGNAESLFEIADMIDPLASKVGFQGQVNENGLSRYFERYPGGGFNLESLKKASSDLFDEISKLVNDYAAEKYTITVIGYSNGANLAKNLLKEYKDVKINNMILFHPSLITPDIGYKKQVNVKVFMSYGKNDPNLTDVEFKEIENEMADAKIYVETYKHNFGHQLIKAEIERAQKFLLNNKGQVNHGKD